MARASPVTSSTFGKADSGDLQTVEQWVLFGDPSLKIGGYET